MVAPHEASIRIQQEIEAGQLLVEGGQWIPGIDNVPQGHVLRLGLVGEEGPGHGEITVYVADYDGHASFWDQAGRRVNLKFGRHDRTSLRKYWQKRQQIVVVCPKE